MKSIYTLCLGLFLAVLALPAHAVEFMLDLKSAANRSYIDPAVGDGKGWTNQGPEDSLGGPKHGLWLYGGMIYPILGTEENGDKQILVFDSAKDPTGLKQVEIPVSEAGAADVGRNLYLLHAAAWVTPGDTSTIATVSVRTDSGKTIDFPIRAGTEVGDWKRPIDLSNGIVAYKETHPAGDVGVFLSRLAVPADAGVPVAVTFKTAGTAEWIVLAAVLTNHDPLATVGGTWTPKAEDGWKAADMSDMDVKAGSALDLSSVVSNGGAAGANGRVIINKQGEFAFEKTPDQPVRFLCYSEISEIPEFATPEQIDALAEQIKRGGYNMLRPHYLDGWLGLKGTAPQLKPKDLDNWEHFAADLKARGIYLFLDITTLLPDIKLPMYYDPAAREYWKTVATAILTHVNPYTGMALKDDPMVAIGQLRNEAGLSYLMARKNPATLLAAPQMIIPFRAWLHKKYATDDAFRAAWTKDGKLPDGVKPEDTIDTINLPPTTGTGPDTLDVQLFFVDNEREFVGWMMGIVQGLGLKAPLTDINNSYSLESDLTRDILPTVDEHAYFDHPRFSHVPTDADTAEMAGNPLRNGIFFYFDLPTMRQLGRPFTMSEWGQVFWNPYRFQVGLTIPAYASLQGWQMLAQFTNPIRPVVAEGTKFDLIAAEPFRLFKDPSTRAGEYMAALIFRRGDVQRSPHNVELLVDPKEIEGKLALQDAPSSVISRVALVTALGSKIPSWPGAAPRGDYHADLSLTPDSTQAISTQEGAQSLAQTPTVKPQAVPALFEKLRTAGILSADNRTDTAKGLYESDTKQIFFDAQNGIIQVNTPMSQGATVVPASPGFQLTDLGAKVNGIDAAVYAGSLTQQPLATTPHVLFLLVPDSLNTMMRFANDKRQRLVDNGRGPVLMRTLQADFTLHNSAPGTAHLWALANTGERVEEIPLTEKDGTLSAHIDTAALKKGPTPYFEIVRGN